MNGNVAIAYRFANQNIVSVGVGQRWMRQVRLNCDKSCLQKPKWTRKSLNLNALFLRPHIRSQWTVHKYYLYTKKCHQKRFANQQQRLLSGCFHSLVWRNNRTCRSVHFLHDLVLMRFLVRLDKLLQQVSSPPPRCNLCGDLMLMRDNDAAKKFASPVK